jgi:ClpP class serine protease
MYKHRIELYKQLEEMRSSKLIVYVTGDRRGLETHIADDVLGLFVDHLDKIGAVPKISLYLYTSGGMTLAAWSIANLIRQFCDQFEVLVPSKSHSAGTLICLGANTIVMTKQATLGPIDPSVNTPLNPGVPGGPPNVRIPVSVEAINGFIELAKEIGVESSSDRAAILSTLASHIHPLVLGQVYRTRGQIQMLARSLLSAHIKGADEEKIRKLVSFLCSESGSHDYTIYRKAARDELGLNVEHVEHSDAVYGLIKSIYDNIAAELELAAPYDPNLVLGANDQSEYQFTRCVLESVKCGSHRFVSRGRLTKRRVQDTQAGVIREGVQDNRSFEGWEHDQR